MDSFDVQSGLMDPTLVNNFDMSAFPDPMALDMAPTNLDTTALGEIEPMTSGLTKDPSHAVDVSDPVTTNAGGAGAGPLPIGFIGQSGPGIGNAGSTLSEFTKRRNWSQRVLEEIRDLLYILTPDGRLLYASPSAKALTGHDPADLLGKSISEFIHPDDSSLFIREFNESIATGNPLRFFYRFRTLENKYNIFECHGHPHLTNDISTVDMTGSSVSSTSVCGGFFMMARPYPTTNSALLDSFLEHKIENVRLQARIAALKREEAEDVDNTAEQFHKQASGPASRTGSISENHPGSPSISSKNEAADFASMPPPAKPTVSNIALTREALDEANSFAKPDSIRDKMARYEGSSHVDSIEMLTGLRYREGERSHGISTGGTSPALIRGDAGIHIPLEKAESRYNSFTDKKPKKSKGAEEYVCTDCGTLDSPEWRKGPNGPKTLCNACGLRWAKKEKKRSGIVDGTDNGSGSNTLLSEVVGASGKSGDRS